MTRIRISSLISLAGLWLVLSPTATLADYSSHPDALAMVERLVESEKFDRATLIDWMADAKKSDRVLEAMSRPAEKVKRWDEYRPIFIQPIRVSGGVEFMREHFDLLARAERKYGVPAEVITAIIGVETRYGRYKGKDRVIDSVSTLAFDYPKRSAFFSRELEEFFKLCREEGFNPSEVKGSYAGAMGMPQFISSSYRHYAVDFDGDGRRDLFNSPADIIGSVANYFHKHHWKKGGYVAIRASADNAARERIEPTRLTADQTVRSLTKAGVVIGGKLKGSMPAGLLEFDLENSKEYWVGLHNFFVITKYNRSPMYALAVYQLSQAIRAQADTAL